MTFDAICALDRETLELAIETWCYPAHRWRPVAHPPDWWMLTTAPDEPGVTWSSVPHLHHTASWDKAMALAWTWQIGLWPVQEAARWYIWLAIPASVAAGQGAWADTEDEARLQIGRLAVWRAMQQGKEDAHA